MADRNKFCGFKGEDKAQSNHTRDQMRQGIVEESVQVLRRHGKSDAEIRAIILSGFHIDAAALDKILGA